MTRATLEARIERLAELVYKLTERVNSLECRLQLKYKKEEELEDGK